MTRPPAHRRTSSPTRRPRATSERERGDLDGPLREVVYIFEREGPRGGAFWLLVLECGHAVSRSRHEAKSLSAFTQSMFRPLAEKLAPKRMQCHYCGAGCEKHDPWKLIKALGGEMP